MRYRYPIARPHNSLYPRRVSGTAAFAFASVSVSASTSAPAFAFAFAFASTFATVRYVLARPSQDPRDGRAFVSN